MFDRAKLQALDMVTLSKLREAVSDVLNHQMRLRAASGQQFEVILHDETKRPGQRVRITGVGNKHLQGYEINQDGTHLYGKKWRLSVGSVSVVPNFEAKPIQLVRRTPLRTANDRPATEAVF